MAVTFTKTALIARLATAAKITVHGAANIASNYTDRAEFEALVLQYEASAAAAKAERRAELKAAKLARAEEDERAAHDLAA